MHVTQLGGSKHLYSIPISIRTFGNALTLPRPHQRIQTERGPDIYRQHHWLPLYCPKAVWVNMLKMDPRCVIIKGVPLRAQPKYKESQSFQSRVPMYCTVDNHTLDFLTLLALSTRYTSTKSIISQYSKDHFLFFFFNSEPIALLRAAQIK